MNTAAHRLIFRTAVADSSAYSSGDDLYGYNPHRGQFMPVAEIARSHGKGRRAGRIVANVGGNINNIENLQAIGGSVAPVSSVNLNEFHEEKGTLPFNRRSKGVKGVSVGLKNIAKLTVRNNSPHRHIAEGVMRI